MSYSSYTSKCFFFSFALKMCSDTCVHVFGHDINDINANRFKSNIKKWMKIH